MGHKLHGVSNQPLIYQHLADVKEKLIIKKLFSKCSLLILLHVHLFVFVAVVVGSMTK